MDMLWISQLSMPGLASSWHMPWPAATQAWKAWPASWVSTSTSPEVPLKLENTKGAP